MDFSVDEPMQKVLVGMGELVEQELFPRERRVGERGFVAMVPELDEVRAEVKRRGWWAPQAPRELGGMGLTLLEHGLVSAVLGRSPLGHYCFGCQAPDAGNIEILHKYGTPAQKAKWLQPLVDGKIRSCFSMTEPDLAGSNPTQLATTARKEGDSYVIDGHKWFTSAADGAAFAIVMAVTNPAAPPHLRASQIVVPTDTPGFRLVRNISVMGSAGGGYASHGEVKYENCRVPVENLLGEEGGGFLIAQERLGPGRIHHCMRWIGICDRAFDLMCRRANARSLGEGKTVATKQIVQAWIAESRAEIESARLLTLEAAWTIDRKGYAEARELVSLIKFHVAGVLQRVVDRAVQVHGALGLTDDTPLGMFYAHERAARIYDGPDEVHKVVVAKRILARYPVG